MNKVILMGRLTADPELRQTTSGIASCRFTVAVNRRFADKNTGERQADFISCTAWRQTAEFVSRYFRKGSMICVEGTLRTGSYADRNHPDVTHYTTDVFVDNVEFTGSKAESQGSSSYSAPQNNYNYQTPAQQAPATAQPANNNENLSFGDLGDFEEIIGDGDVPF
ncbi:MAG: single-stranded DNA-binding protein [Ruminococcus sp.]|nr:single-stranded DNA-binding protein [Ruminococcus sp.]CDF03087.1 single-stranded DNA-binding protein [Ruminococcus sp. CAG:624]